MESKNLPVPAEIPFEIQELSRQVQQWRITRSRRGPMPDLLWTLAANWIMLGLTTGRGKDDQTNRPNRPLKQVLGYPLTKDFRRLLKEAR